MDTAWQKLSPDEKMERRFAAWLAAEDIEFASPEAEADYKARVQRLADAVRLQKTPDRVPVYPSIGAFDAYYAGFTSQDMMYDAEKAVAAAIKCTLDFQADARLGAAGLPGKALEILNYKLYHWPGHGVGPNDGLQFVEGEYMTADEYDALMEDPTDFWLRTYFPRTIGELEGLSLLSPQAYVRTGIGRTLASFGQPEVQVALEKLAAAGREARAWQEKMAAGSKRLEELGFPSFGAGSSTHAPFDVIGNALRGTREVMMDIFRRPEKLLEAIERITPAVTRMGLAGANRLGRSPIVMVTLHKGADGFMSLEQYKRFYWPGLRKVIYGLIEEGFVPHLFAEGAYASRLEVIRDDLPKGKTIWHFDYTDMALAKEIIGDRACMMGNVPVAMMHAGTPDQVTAYCRELIDTAGKGGGFILAGGATVDRNGKAENIHAMVRCAKEYGLY